jgi:hypothetical protein
VDRSELLANQIHIFEGKRALGSTCQTNLHSYQKGIMVVVIAVVMAVAVILVEEYREGIFQV